MEEKLHILYLEDELEIQNSMREFLSIVFSNIICVQNGLEGLKLIEGGLRPDIIITDINMPKMDGFEFIEVLRERNISVPVIITSANIINKEDLLKNEKYSTIHEIIRKPIDIRILLETCKELAQYR